MKKLTLFLLMSVLLCGCAADQTLTRDQRIAQRKLRKALKHDPDIIKKQYTDTLIRSYAEGVARLQLQAERLSTDAFACDSINRELAALEARARARGDSNAQEIYLYQDSLASISVKREGGNKMSISYRVKDRIVDVPVRIPYEVKVTVPGKVVTQFKPYPAWHYFWFYALSALLLVLLLLCIRTLPVRAVMSNLLTSRK